MIKIQKAQVEAAIALLREKVALQERLVHTLKARGTWEGLLIFEVISKIVVIDNEGETGGAEKRLSTLNRYIAAHKEHYHAQADLDEIILAELKSQLAIHEAMMKEAENPSVIVSGVKM